MGQRVHDHKTLLRKLEMKRLSMTQNEVANNIKNDIK